MALISVIFSDLEGQFLLFETFLTPIPLEIQHVLTTIYAHELEDTRLLICDLNCLTEIEGLLKVIGSVVNCKCGNIITNIIIIIIIIIIHHF